MRVCKREGTCTGAVYACIKEQVGVRMRVIAHAQTRDFLPLYVCMSAANERYLCICKQVYVCVYLHISDIAA